MGQAAFHKLAAMLRGEQEVDPHDLGDPSFQRLASTLCGTDDASSLDRAVLLRQALRYAGLNAEVNVHEPRFLIRRGLTGIEDFAHVGVLARTAAEGTWVEAMAWRPSWLPDIGKNGADAATGEFVRRQLPGAPADPFLARLKREHYQSAGQRAAVRAALTAPPGSVLVVCLPTGEGKSFVFQTVAEVGFGDPGVPSGPGVTLVVTPTVALAQDHERASRDVGLPDQPRAYIGGDAERNALLRQRVWEGSQGLLFASPEAACGPLRAALVHAADIGALRALVVDEAHLVDAWGAEFRPEFQSLSGLRRTLLHASANTTPIRTLLLSATYTDATVVTLRALFGDQESTVSSQFAVVAAARLRPEPDYWVAPITHTDERSRRVEEAMLHVPRPAILYTTRVDDAEQWDARLRTRGFRRLACVTGDTDRHERARVVDAWRAGRLDLVVATSAFGLGIDNPHVRSVVHACIPETLDRFYQEVGRGGRDGNSCLSLVIPCGQDFDVATSLNRVKLVTVELGRERWGSMFRSTHRVEHGNRELTVPLDVASSNIPDRIDMRSGLNTDWNKRTLALMASSGLITLEGPVTSRPVKGYEATDDDAAEPAANAFQTVRIMHDSHLDAATWQSEVEARRVAVDNANAASLRRMSQFVRDPAQRCLADRLAPLYQVSREACGLEGDGYAVEVAQACGGCPACRSQGRTRLPEIGDTPQIPWPAKRSLRPPADGLLDSTQRLLVFYENELQDIRMRERRHVIGAFAQLIRAGFRNVFIENFNIDLEALAEAARIPFFVAHRRDAQFLPVGPTLVLVGKQLQVRETLLASHGHAEGRIIVLWAQTADPDIAGRTLRSRYPHRKMLLDDLVRECGT